MNKKIPYYEMCGCKVCNCTMGEKMIDPSDHASASYRTSSTINDFSIVYENESNKRTLETLIDSLSEEEWGKIKNRVESKRAHETSKRLTERKKSSIEFGDWILKHNVMNGYDNEGSSCWVVPDGNGECFTTADLYSIYITGQWEEDESDWDSTLEDGLEDL